MFPTVLSAIATRLAVLYSTIALAACRTVDAHRITSVDITRQLPHTLEHKVVRVYQVNQFAQGLHLGQSI
jgi:hypothetical protein